MRHECIFSFCVRRGYFAALPLVPPQAVGRTRTEGVGGLYAIVRGDHKHTLLAASFRRFAVHRLCNTAALQHPLRGNSSKNLLAKSACSPKRVILCSDKAKAAGRAERTFKAFNAVSTQNKRFGPCAYHSRALLIPPRAHRISSCISGGDTSRKGALPFGRALFCARATPAASGAPTTFSVGG